jgi:hypothetical protein
MKKLVKTISTIILLNCANVYAEDSDIKVKIGGLFDFRGAVYNPDNSTQKGSATTVTPHQENFGLLTSGNVFVDVSNKINEDTSYGAKISLIATTRNNKQVPSFLYFTSKLGKIELGSNKSAFKTLGVSGYTNACNADFSDWTELDPKKKEIIYTDINISFLDSKMRIKGETEYARKVTYYTPSIEGFQLGISYIPDLSNSGIGLPGDKTYYDIVNYFYKNSDGESKRVPYKFSVKDAIAGGVSFKKDFDNDFGIKLSLVAEKGNVIVKSEEVRGIKVNDIKEKDKKIDDLKMSNDDIAKYQGAKFKDLMSYMIGGEVKFKDFSIAASYVNAGDSFTSKELDTDGHNADCMIFGGRYNFGNLGTSVSYFTSDNKKNKLNALTFSVDYKAAEGLVPYAEFTRYSTEGFDPVDKVKDTGKGSVFILGARLSF